MIGQKTNYEAVIGLEIHVQLRTKTKMFAPEATQYGAPPNTQTSAITLAHPGTMPTVSREAVSHAIKMGLACQANITAHNWFDRKNYYYYDLPKGYQITQDKTPICRQGEVIIDTAAGETRAIPLTRIHLEEDTGKSMHTPAGDKMLVNFDRTGTPLIEIVTAPALHTAEEASSFVAEIRRLVRYLGISDGDMEKGSLRCDANVSIKPKGSKVLGNKVELKNMNSMRHIRLAITHEIARQIDLKQEGTPITSQTRAYDVQKGESVFKRKKEGLTDYRFFTEPDISPFYVSPEWIATERKAMPALPRALMKKFIHTYHLNPKDAAVLVDEKATSLYFEAICQHTPHYKPAANWVIGPIKSYLNREKIAWADFTLTPKTIAALVDIVAAGKINFSGAVQKLFTKLVENPSLTLVSLLKGQVLQISDEAQLNSWITAALDKYPAKIKAYHAGQHGLLGLFMGEVMRLSDRKADPKKTMTLLTKQLTTRQ
ncbi:MAG: Asp-tRNA(Asn)/Glu-tRNA(Gln) amidotransferase subunit GatB [Bacteroidota bacterium]